MRQTPASAIRRTPMPSRNRIAPANNVYGRCSAVPVSARARPPPSVPVPLLLASLPSTAVGVVDEVVESPGEDVELVLDVLVLEVELVLDVELVLEVDDELVLDVEVELVLDVVVAAVENVMAPTAPVVRSFGSSATRMVQACWSSQANKWLGPLPAKTVKLSEPAPDASEFETTTVRKSQSDVGFVGAALHCSITGLKFARSPVHETVTVAASVKPLLGLTVTAPTAPPTWTKKMLGTSSASPARHSSAEARPSRRRAA